jgi:hypothetical protein
VRHGRGWGWARTISFFDNDKRWSTTSHEYSYCCRCVFTQAPHKHDAVRAQQMTLPRRRLSVAWAAPCNTIHTWLRALRRTALKQYWINWKNVAPNGISPPYAVRVGKGDVWDVWPLPQ